ncbi:MAG: HAD hydrolase-like protein [Clostridia bacterium]
MLKYILFDLDGTLTNPEKGIVNCAKFALEYYGIHEEDNDKLRSFIGPPLHKSFSQHYGFSTEKAREAIAKYRERFSTIGLFENEPYDGVVDMLKLLKEKGLKMAIASSKPEVFVKKISDKFGFTPYLDFQVGCHLDGTLEEKEEVMAKALELLNVQNKEEAIMVGDRKFDVEGSKINAVKCIGIKLGFATENELEEAGADYVVQDIKELTELLLNMM